MTRKEREELREIAEDMDASCTGLGWRLLTVQKALRFCWCQKIPVEGALLNAAATELDNIWHELSGVGELARNMVRGTTEEAE